MPGLNVDPTDVFPQRNLPIAANPWGRAIESRVKANESLSLILQQSSKSLNRGTAAQLAGLADQITRVTETTRVVGESFYVENLPGTNQLAPGGSLLVNRPSWATHAIVEFTAMTVTDLGDLTGEVAVEFYFDDTINVFGVPAYLSAGYLVDGVTGGVALVTQPLIIEVTSGTLEWNGTVEQTIAGTGSLMVQTYVKITWITRGAQTQGDFS